MSNIQFSTTALFISNFKASFPVGTIVETLGYTTKGDGGGAKWQKTATTGQTVSQSPAQLGLPLLNDGNGNQWAMSLTNTASFKTFALLQASTSGNVGQELICRERANASYIIQASSYSALAGDATLANGRVAALQVNVGISPLYFGASVSNADNSTQLLAFFTRVFSEGESGSINVFGKGIFEVASGVQVLLTTNHTKPININLNGIQILASSSFDNVLPLFSIISQSINRHLSFRNGYFDGNSIANKVCVIDGGDATSTQFLYNCLVENNVFRRGIVSSLEVTGNVFESSFVDNHGQLANTTGKVFNIVNRLPNALSSLEFRGGSTRGGLNGLYTDAGDIKIYGGTYIESGEYALDCRNGTGALISGVHVENAWQDGTGTDNAGINLTGAGTLERCLATSINGIHDTLYDVFASSQGISIIGGQTLGGVSKSLRVKDGSGKISTLDITRSECTFPGIAEQRVTSFAEKGQYLNATSVSGTVTPDVDSHDIFVYSVVNATTIADPVNIVAGDRITIIIKQDATGGRAVTLGAQYKGSASVATGSAAVTTLVYLFSGGSLDLLSENTY
jgi:hypothetical protein